MRLDDVADTEVRSDNEEDHDADEEEVNDDVPEAIEAATYATKRINKVPINLRWMDGDGGPRRRLGRKGIVVCVCEIPLGGVQG